MKPDRTHAARRQIEAPPRDGVPPANTHRPRVLSTGRAPRIDADLVGLDRQGLDDVYYELIDAPWWKLLASLVVMYLLANCIFAGIYLIVGGVAGARPGNFFDAFFFSVQTMATIGYGAMSPTTPIANTLVTMEALVGMLGVAMATGVVFSKFARPAAKLIWSDVAVIAKRDGVPSLMFRVGNQRGNHVVEAKMKLWLIQNETTSEGERVRRWNELNLPRDVSPIFALTWTAVHPINESSLLFGLTPQAMFDSSLELIVTLQGVDATFANTIHARHSYNVTQIRWNERFEDIMSLTEGDRRVVDFSKFHQTRPLDQSATGATIQANQESKSTSG